MKKVIILIMLLGSAVSLFSQYSDHENLIRRYFRNLETPGKLKTAYKIF